MTVTTFPVSSLIATWICRPPTLARIDHLWSPPKFDSSRPEGGDFSVAGVEESGVYEREGAEGL